MIEIELKAWAPDLEAVRARLLALNKPPRASVTKEDVYYAPASVDPRVADQTRDRLLRVRVHDGHVVLTAKRKKIEAGVETSDEIELAVEDRAALERLLDYLGYVAFLQKKKETRAFSWDDVVSVELNRIAGLGDFVEVEALVRDGASAREVEAARARVREVLGELGVGEERIEPRPYMDLIRERASA